MEIEGIYTIFSLVDFTMIGGRFLDMHGEGRSFTWDEVYVTTVCRKSDEIVNVRVRRPRSERPVDTECRLKKRRKEKRYKEKATNMEEAETQIMTILTPRLICPSKGGNSAN